MNSAIKEKPPKTVFRIAGFALAALVLLGSPLLQLISLLLGKNPRAAEVFAGYSVPGLLLSYGCVYGLGFLVYWLIIRLAPKGATMRREKFGFGRLFGAFCFAYLMGIGGNAIGSMINLVTGKGLNVSEMLVEFTNSGILPIIILVIVAPVVEELIFRKLLIDRTLKYGEKTAVILSGLAFGLFHMNLTQFIYAAAIGMVFGYIYARSGRIYYTMILHCAINTFSLLVSLLAAPLMDSLPDIDLADLMDPYSAAGSFSVDAGEVLLLLVLLSFTTFFIVFGFITMFRKVIRIRFDYSSPDLLPKGQIFKTVYLNIGMIIFIAICLAWIVLVIVVN